MSRKISRENLILILISSAILIYLALPLFWEKGLPINNDWEVYPTWLTEFEKNIADGNLIPRWAPNLWHGMGSPLFIFVSPGFYYLAKFFRLFSFSILFSVKLGIYLSFALGFIFMFLFTKKIWGKWPALFCATVYTFMPYHMGLVMTRGDYAELLAMALWPVNLLIFHNLVKTKKEIYFLLGSLLIAAQMLAHNILSVIFIPVIFLFIIFLSRKTWADLKLPLLTLGLGVLLASFFWLPAFIEKNDLNLAELTEGITMNMGQYDFHNHFVKFSEFISIQADDFYDQAPKFLSYLGMLIIILSIFFFLRKFKSKGKSWRHLGFWLLILSIGLLMSTALSVFIWESLPPLSLFQYPSRFLSIVSLAVGVLAGTISLIFKGKALKIICIAFSLIYIFTAAGYSWPARHLEAKDDETYQPAQSLLTQMQQAAQSGTFYQEVDKINLYAVEPSTMPQGVDIPSLQLLRSAMVLDDTKRLRKGEEIDLPIFPKIERTKGVEIIESEIKSTQYRIKVRASQNSGLIINTLFFPGWRVWLDGQPLLQENIALHDRLKTMGIALTEGEHQVVVRFTDTAIRTASKVISALALLAVIIIFIFLKKSARLDQDFHQAKSG